MTVTDTCGNESGFSPYHVPIFLQFGGYIGGVNLSWEKYQVEGKEISFDSYNLYRGSDSTQLELIEENIPAEVSVFTDKDPVALENNYFYRVAGLLSDPCNPSGGTEKAGTGPYTHSLSNLEDNKLKSSGLGSLYGRALLIYPNPATDIVTVRFGGPVSGKALLIITDMTGKKVKVFRELSGEKFSFGVSDLQPGYYHLELAGERTSHANLIVR
jgi:hypothetical protein